MLAGRFLWCMGQLRGHSYVSSTCRIFTSVVSQSWIFCALQVHDMDGEIGRSRAHTEELERGIENLAKGDSLRESLAEAVRRAAVAQVYW